MFRTGTTSYIIPADILPNVVYLAPQVDDVELVLFETDEYGSNLPDAGLHAQLGTLAEAHNLTYTVHLPLDLRLGAGCEASDLSLVKARRVIEATRDLNPYAYTVHLDGRELVGSGLSGAALERWRANAATGVGDSLRLARPAGEAVCGKRGTLEPGCLRSVDRGAANQPHHRHRPSVARRRRPAAQSRCLGARAPGWSISTASPLAIMPRSYTCPKTGWTRQWTCSAGVSPAW